MKPENENLIRDLLDDTSHRENTLLAGGRILRRRRHWRVARRSVALVTLLLAATALWLRKQNPHSAPAQVSKMAPKVPAMSHVHALTDDELLALFPNTPVGLASLPDGKKRLIFPRPGDEQKFITRL